ncbi:hypothetical protein QAD02_024001, partial [Eretmocerus hayati]
LIFLAMDEDTGEEYSKKFVQLKDKASLNAFLTAHGIDENTANILQAQDISGEFFLELSQSDVLAMKITMGHAKQLMRIIRELNQDGIQQSEEPPQKNCEMVETAQAHPDIELVKSHIGESRGKSSTVDTKDGTEVGPADSQSGSLKRSFPSTSSPTCDVKKRPRRKSKKILEGSGGSHVKGGSGTLDQPTCSSSSNENIVPLDSFTRFGTVRKTLENHQQGSKTLYFLDCPPDVRPFIEPDRKELVRIVVAELTDTHSKYPPDEAKEALAKALVTEFPRLRNELSPLGYEHYYHPDTKKGFITNRLITVQRNLPQEEKPYDKSEKLDMKSPIDCSSRMINNINLLPEKELNEKIATMKRKDPTKHADKIKELMAETYYDRRNWILGVESPSVTDVLATYIHLKSFEGDSIDDDFERLARGKGDSLIGKFPSFYEQRLIYYARFAKHSLLEKYKDEKDCSLKALLILIELLRVPNAVVNYKTKQNRSKNLETNVNVARKNDREKGKKKEKAPALETYFLKILTEGTDPETFVQNVRKQNGCSVQPYLLGVGPAASRCYFVVADNTIFSRKITTDVISTVDLLFKIYQVFNLNYPPQICYFYEFIETFIYKCREYSTDAITSLHVNLMNIKSVPQIDEECESGQESDEC